MNYLHISSPAFREMGSIPQKYTCKGANVNPPLDIAHIPDAAKTLAIIVEDPDACVQNRVHWLAWNIPVVRHIIEERTMEYEGMNDFGLQRYTGPYSPFGIHRYQFKVYALDTVLQLAAGSSRGQLVRAMSDYIVGSGEVTGAFAGRRSVRARVGLFMADSLTAARITSGLA